MSESPMDEGGKPALPEIAGYRLLRVIGSGGMSTVYLGEQVSLSRQVAIKVMLPEALADEVSRRRFENEARTIARLEHPHIVGIHEVGRTRDGLPWYSMPHLPRGHLGQRILGEDGKPMPQARVVEILRALLSALGYAHARGTIHRDVKAENVLFDEAGRALLADFGIALRRGFGTRVTTAGVAVGSTAYMAPEQARGKEVDPRTDLYAVGVLAWEMLTGELPYNAGDAVSMAIMHVKEPVPRLPPQLRHWQRFIDRALAKSPRKRYHDAAEMLAALERVPLRGGSHEMPALPALRERAAGGIRRVPTLVWIGLVLVAAAAAGLLLRSQQEGFSPYRVAKPSVDAATNPVELQGTLPAPVSPDQPIVGDPDSALLRAAPVSQAEQWVVQADQQIRARHLTAPDGDNAYDSLLAAYQRDVTFSGLGPAIDRLVAALADAAAQAIAAGDDARARTQVAAANRLLQRTQRGDGRAQSDLQRRIEQALTARIDKAAGSFDRASALATLESAKSLGVSATARERMAARANAIPQPGQEVPGMPGDMMLIRKGGAMLAAARHPVSRDDYARFAAATGREPALCRASGSLLRLLAPRDWKSPGFKQAGTQPVVCVSWNDAQAYARWLSDRSGHDYRLPHAREAGLLPAGDNGKRVAEWNSDCSKDCDSHLVSGASWRGENGTRPLDASRGYDDVGIRLVSDLRQATGKR